MSGSADPRAAAPADAHTLERLVPDELVSGDATGQETLALHLERYEFAARHVRGARLLDMACGVGYGTRLLADRCPQVSALGVDLDPKSVAYAKERYGSGRVEYLQADAMRFAQREPFDTIVSLETVEHLPEPQQFLKHVVELLAPGGVLISSVPTTPSVDGNPHHLHDFTERSFRRMLTSCGLRELDCLRQEQPYSFFAVATRSETRMQSMRRNLPGYYLTHPASFVRRIASVVKDGFVNRYLTVVATRDAARAGQG